MKTEKSTQLPSLEPASMNATPRPAWVGETARRIAALDRLGPNWDSHGGLPLAELGKKAAFHVLDCLSLLNIPAPAVVLASSGTIQFEWQVGGRTLELNVGDGQIIECVKVDPQGNIEEAQLTDSIPKQLSNLAQWLING